MRRPRILYNIIGGILIIAVISTGYLSFKSIKSTRDEKKVKDEYSGYAPADPLNDAYNTSQDEFDADSTGQKLVNKSLQGAVNKNKDIVGWIRLSATNIDYPFVHTDDNSSYLRYDLDGNYSQAGTIFMDYRSNPDLSSFNTIIYGHNMNDGTMFASVPKYKDDEYFNSHRDGYIFTLYGTYELKVFAYATVKSTDTSIYNVPIEDEYKNLLLKNIKEKSTIYHDDSVTAKDKIVSLSTCSYDFYGARSVIFAKITKIE